MPPKNKYSKEEIIEAAFNIAKQEGIDGITIRKVAKKLNSSIAPIYVNFSDINELKKVVIEKIYEISNSMILEQNTEEIFLNVGIASVKFAKEYSVIFKELMLKNNNHMENYDQEIGNTIVQEMKKKEEFKSFTDEEIKTILMKMRIFQVGLSIMATNESFASELTEEKMIELLKSTGDDVINSMKARKI